MSKMRPLSLLIFTVSAVALAACTSWLGGEELKVTPVSKMSGLTTEPRDPLYESAVTAINERDYGRALDYLQEAKARNPSNIKVLNALGVVYDKLGRFDLSARYYVQARAIDPNSQVVAANVTYSNSLQGLTDPNVRRPVARLDLPENFNPGPAEKPTVLASVPAANDAIHRPVAAANPPVAAPAILARTEIADSFRPTPKPVEAGPVSTHEPKQLAWVAPRFAVAQAEAPPSANMTALSAAATKPAAEKPAIALPVSTTSKLAELPKVDPVSKPQVAVAIAPTVSAPAKLAEAPEVDPVSKPQVAVAIAPVASAASKLEVEAPKISPVSKPQIAAAIAPTVSAPTKLAETPKINPVSKPRVVAAAAPSVAKPAERTRLARLPAVPAAAAQPLPRRVAALPVKKKLFIIGQPVRIMNASGKPDRVGTVSRRLSSLGWTVRLAEAGRSQPVTTLVYNTRNVGAAKAMQRTLPFPVRLVAESGPAGMRLVVGRDYLSWKSKNTRLHALWQKDTIVASLQAKAPKGVR